MRNIDLIITDIDGTLYNSNRQISSKTKQFLLNLEKQGTKIALCSGRMPKELKAIETELQLNQYNGYLIHTNGSGILNCQTKEEISFSPIELDEIQNLVQFARKHKLYSIAEYKGSYITECRYTTHLLRLLIQIFWPKNKHPKYVRLRQFIYMTKNATEVKDILVYLDKPIHKIIIKGRKKNVDIIEDYLRQKKDIYRVYRLSSGCVEINHTSVNKGRAALYLLDQLHLSQENVYAFGDSINDHDLLRVIQNSVAMANADAKTKQLAKYTTKSNDEDGIYWFFEKNSTI